MMRTVFIICLFGLLMSSCASFSLTSVNRFKNTQKYVNSNQFDKALEIIKTTPKDHQSHNELNNLIPDIEQAREEYIRKTLNQAKLHEKQQDWFAAKRVIEDSLKKLPHAKGLAIQHQYYQQKLSERIAMDKIAILTAEAQFYINVRPYWESLQYNSNANFIEKRKFRRFLKHANNVSNQLFVLGQSYWSQKKVTQAKETLLLSTKTSHNANAEALLHDIAEFQRQEAVASGRAIELDIESTKLEQSFLEKLSENDFSSAQYILNEMTARNLPLIKQKQALLAQQKKEASETYKAKGHALYNAGSIKEAIHQWEQALALTPEDNGLQQQLERAKRFLNNLERWQEDN